MAKRKADESTEQEAPAPKTKAKKSNLPSFPWKDNDNKLIWELLTEAEKPENSKILFGTRAKGENTSGDRKVTVYKRIGQVILPEFFALEPTMVADRSKAMIEKLISKYKEHAQRLRQTGGGIGASDQLGEKLEMKFYIAPDGPDCTTLPEAVNLWASIEKDFPFFPRLHLLLATRPNVTPIAITTGLGPTGPSTLYYQRPDEPALTPSQTQQIGCLHDALIAAGAYANPSQALWSGDDGNLPDDSQDQSFDLPDGSGANRNESDDDDDITEVTAPGTPASRRSELNKENILPTPASKSRGPKALQQDASIEKRGLP
ncbi:hypothetical protein C8J57DRAFT_55130 [Mycena rebaudengoi]|nr:hypothetical protein C8J57DRAFT_55130 [Mycena rebaudengoi]